MADPTSQKVAFALGGLGGSNAHGAGFLQAARTKDVRPDIISCTSGMIFWVYHYLKHTNLEAELRRHTQAQAWFPPGLNWLNWTRALTLGVPGVFRPATFEHGRRWLQPWNLLDSTQWFDRLLPAQRLVPTRSPALFADIAQVFTAEPTIGVVFNVFEPQSDTEYLHINDAAATFMDKQYGEADSGGVIYAPIDAAAVENALWLYLYGFENKTKVDGAYHRQIILRELHNATTIYAVRPQAEQWIGDLPSNLLQMRDFEIELWFNSNYDGDVAGIKLINRLLTDNLLNEAGRQKYDHVIDVVPIEIGVNRGFFDYFVDDMDTYHEAFAKALRAFTQPSREGTAAGGAPLPADHSTQQAPAGGGAAAQLQPDGQSNST